QYSTASRVAQAGSLQAHGHRRGTEQGRCFQAVNQDEGQKCRQPQKVFVFAAGRRASRHHPTASSTTSVKTASPSSRASRGIVNGGAILTVCPQAPTGAKNSNPLWKLRSTMS